jgi:hypothetical protein
MPTKSAATAKQFVDISAGAIGLALPPDPGKRGTVEAVYATRSKEGYALTDLMNWLRAKSLSFLMASVINS